MGSIFLTTCARCGTHWTKRILMRTLRVKERPDIHAGDAKFAESVQRALKLEKEQPGGKIYREHCPLGHLEVLPEYMPVIALVRDMRGVLVSAAYYYLVREHRKRSVLESIGASESDPRAFDLILARLKETGHNIWWFQGYLDARSRVSHALLRYEDLVEDPVGPIARALDEWAIPFDLDRLEEAAAYWTFERLSEGRHRGQEQMAHHYRKGDPNDWKNYFTEAERLDFYDRFRPYLEVFGYTP